MVDPLHRFQQLQAGAGQQMVIKAKLETETWRRIALWLSSQILQQREDFQVADGRLCIPKLELDQVPSTMTYHLDKADLFEDVSCSDHTENEDECPACVSAQASVKPVEMVIVTLAPKEDGNGLVRPSGPGLVLP